MYSIYLQNKQALFHCLFIEHALYFFLEQRGECIMNIRPLLNVFGLGGMSDLHIMLLIYSIAFLILSVGTITAIMIAHSSKSRGKPFATPATIMHYASVYGLGLMMIASWIGIHTLELNNPSKHRVTRSLSN
jgi:hypothetical protein